MPQPAVLTSAACFLIDKTAKDLDTAETASVDVSLIVKYCNQFDPNLIEWLVDNDNNNNIYKNVSLQEYSKSSQKIHSWKIAMMLLCKVQIKKTWISFNIRNNKKEWKSNCIKELNTIILQMNELDQPALNTLVNTATEQAQLQLLKNILVI